MKSNDGNIVLESGKKISFLGNVLIEDSNLSLSSNGTVLSLNFPINISSNLGLTGDLTQTGDISLTGDLGINGNIDSDIVKSNFLKLDTSTDLTISSGEITITQSFHKIVNESDASTDSIDTINGGNDGDILFISKYDSSKSLVLNHNTGNIWNVYGFDLSVKNDKAILLFYHDSYWYTIGAFEEIEGDNNIVLDFIPSNYTRNSSGVEGDSVQKLSSHLNGIDSKFNETLYNLSEDATPELGGNLNGSGNTIHNVLFRSISETSNDIGITEELDTAFIADLQTPSGATNLTLTSSPVTSGTFPRRITVSVGANESSVNFQITYKDENGDSQTSSVYALPSTSGTHYLDDEIWATEVSQISVSGATSGNISFGFDDALVVFDISLGNYQTVALISNAKIVFDNWPSSGACYLTLNLINGDDYTISWEDDITIINSQTTISVDDTDNSFNDSGSGFSGVEKWDTIIIEGFTETNNNGDFIVKDDCTLTKIECFNSLTTESAGDEVTLKRAVLTDRNGKSSDPDISNKYETLIFWSNNSGRNIYFS